MFAAFTITSTSRAVMSAWTVVFYVAQRLLWRAGLKRFSAMGA